MARLRSLADVMVDGSDGVNRFSTSVRLMMDAQRTNCFCRSPHTWFTRVR